MKIKIKREQSEISEDQIVKEKSNMQKWVDVFIKMAHQPIYSIEIWAESQSKIFDEMGYDATEAYEKIVEGKI